jgi:hypothetical protein
MAVTLQTYDATTRLAAFLYHKLHSGSSIALDSVNAQMLSFTPFYNINWGGSYHLRW